MWRRGCSGRRRARPPARLGVLTSFGAAPRSPPVPSVPSGALHTGGDCGAVWCRPGPAAAHQHRGRSLRRPPHRWCLWFWCARPGPAAAHRHCGRSLWRPSAPSALASLALRRVARCGVSKPGQAPLPPSNFACNSLGCVSWFEVWLLEFCGFRVGVGSGWVGIACGIGGVACFVVELVAQGCTTWVGIALLSCRCNAVLSGALVLYLVHRFAVVKLVTPFRPCVSAGLKPASPLLA